ncbi:PQQ-binding-like beta-propeller repeat protein [Microbacterium sp. NPDC019599]|uniref:outer membrane protein assembly factor BamB family protein n=1 Tax=Microbacterium sp. NPDC019599 TaxID=3154690 RepID=UPI0033FF279C
MPGAGVVPRRRRRRIIAAAVVCGVVAMGTLALTSATDVRPPVVGGTAAAFLPEDGAVGWAQMAGGVAQYEQRRAPGVAALFVLPTQVAGIAVTAYPDAARAVPHWATYWGPEAGRAGANPRDLYSIGGAGIRIVASSGFPLDSVFMPGMVVLASDVRPGAEWKSEGTSLWAQLGPDGAPQSAEFAYEGDFAAREPEDPSLADHVRDGCLETVSTVTLTPGEGAALVYHQTSLWCPGAGQVASTGGFEGEEPITIPPADEPHVAVQLSARVPSWQHPEFWDAALVAARWVDPLWGDSVFTVSPALRPVMVGEKLAVADLNTGDLTLLREDEQGLVVDRVLRPGGDVIALGAVGELLVVATSQRDLVAYTARGDRVWTRSTPDLVVGAPAGDRAGGLVIGCLDGTVRSLDAGTGEERWSAYVSADGVESVVVVDGLAVTADRVGALAAVDLGDGSALWTDDPDGEVAAFATDGEALFATRDDVVERLDPATGSTVWSTSASTGIDDLALVGDRVVAQTWRDLAAFDVEDGSITWRAPLATAIASDGTALAATSGSRIRLLAADGSDAATWEVPPESLGSFRYLTAAPNAVWMTDAKAGIVRVGP